MRIAWEIHLGRLQQQQQQKQHGAGVLDKDERRPATSGSSDSRYGDRPTENGRSKAQGDTVLLQLLSMPPPQTIGSERHYVGRSSVRPSVVH